MTDAIRLIDEVRKVDVPIMLYVFLYLLGLMLGGGLGYLMLGIIRLYVTLAVVLVVFLVGGITFAMIFITYISFEEEEIEDAMSLATLYNHIKRQRVQQMNYVRMDLKIKSLGEARKQEEVDRCFLLQFNNLRLQALKLFTVLRANFDERQRVAFLDLIFIAYQEILFNNPVVMKRVWG